MKRTVPLLITGFVGFLLLFHYFVPAFGDWANTAAIHFDILAAIAFILGGGNLMRTHGEKIYKQQEGWGYSVIALVAFLTMLSFGLFKVNVPARPGFWTPTPMQSGQTRGLAHLDWKDDERRLMVVVNGAEPKSKHAIFLGEERMGSLSIDHDGNGKFELKYKESEADIASDAAKVLAGVEAGAKVRVGELFAGELASYSDITGEYNVNGSAFWFFYEYGFKPLQQTTFAMLAFYVASAAFRAFRARNLESVLLLGTAFVILLGRTALGTVMTQWLPDEGFWSFLSFFKIPNLTGWIMSVFNTAGNRAIMIGIALGVASMSLKVILGIDRSYLGKEA